MKRIASIVTLACLVVLLTTGSAFARVECGGCGCADRPVAASAGCATQLTSACAMGDGQTMKHSGCGHETTAQQSEVVPAAQNHLQAAVVVEPVVVRPSSLLGGLFSSLRAPDARGAPHLSAVMRN